MAKSSGRFATAVILVTLVLPVPAVHALPEGASVIKVLEVGDLVPGSEDAWKAFSTVDINDAGEWIAAGISEDNADDSNLNDAVVLGSEGVIWREGQAVPGIDGSSIFNLTRAHRLQDGTPVALALATFAPGIGNAVLVGDEVAVRSGDPLSGPKVPSGAEIAAIQALVASPNGALAISGTFAPGTAPNNKFIAVALRGEGGGWNLEVIAANALTPATTVGGQLITDLQGNVTLAVNDAGLVYYTARYQASGPNDTLIALGDTVVHYEGQPIPGGGLLGDAFDATGSLDSTGVVAFGAPVSGLGGADGLWQVVAAGEPVWVSGSEVPESGGTLAAGGYGFSVADSGDVYWGADISGVPGAQSSALLLNDSLMVQGGDTFEGVGEILSISPNFASSADGLQFVFRATLDNLNQAIVVLERPEPSKCDAGDVNGDGDINILDVQCTLNSALWQLGGGAGAAPACLAGDPLGADLNCDDSIDVSDVTVHIPIALEAPLPPEIDANGNQCPDSCE